MHVGLILLACAAALVLLWLAREVILLGFVGVAELDAALASRFCVSVSCRSGENALESLHAQLRVLDALAPDAVTMLDLNACDAKSGDWMRDAASAGVPPGPTSFFTIHSVFDDDRKGRDTWLHTHGLRRMGSIRSGHRGHQE